MPSNSRAAKLPLITLKARCMRLGRRCGKSRGRTAFPSRFRILEHLGRLIFASDSVSPANDAVGRAVGQQPLGPFRECRERGYAVTGFRPRSLNRFQHDAPAVLSRGLALSTRPPAVPLLNAVAPRVGPPL